MALLRIVSGAQTGADRAALEAARAMGFPAGGWVPKGRWAEDGRVPAGLGALRETESAEPAERTRRNVADSDATLILSHGPLRGGSALTREEARRLGKPCLWIDFEQVPLEVASEQVGAWLEQHGVGALNVAGPRASEDAEIYPQVFALVTALLARRALPLAARRICIKGGSGAGKTTFARDLARRLGVDHVELDALHHDPGWTPAPAALLQARVRGALDDTRGWVVDGNYDSKLGALVLDRAELIVWLDLPLATKLRRLARRTVGRWLTQEQIWNGNRENLKTAFWGGDALFPWAVRSHFRHRIEWPRLLAGRPLVRLRTTREVETWLAITSSSLPRGSRPAC